ncbi:MAG: carbohydrate-binding domain-containing protein, partial [Clostridia bacterium]|nr:carbohydrate-binding domain-containing protein [Clostridia bacterium]
MKLKKYLPKAAAIICLCLAALIAIPNLMTGEAASGSVSIKSGTAIFSSADLFTDRDLEQQADTSEAKQLTLVSGSDVTVTEAGVYMVSGSAKECTIYVEAGEEKVQIVLDSVSVTNTSKPVIYVKEADKVFVTLAGESSLSVTGTFTADGSTNTDGVIFSKSDLVLNGTGSLKISSTKNGIVGKDDLKITGGTYVISAQSKCIEANDSIRIAGGTFTLTAGTDGLHVESDDAAKGYIYISGGSFEISARDDGIHATSIVQIDGGEFNISAYEGIEGTYIQLNGGTITITASDDGINAARKINAYTPTIEI